MIPKVSRLPSKNCQIARPVLNQSVAPCKNATAGGNAFAGRSGHSALLVDDTQQASTRMLVMRGLRVRVGKWGMGESRQSSTLRCVCELVSEGSVGSEWEGGKQLRLHTRQTSLHTAAK